MLLYSDAHFTILQRVCMPLGGGRSAGLPVPGLALLVDEERVRCGTEYTVQYGHAP